MMNFGLIAAFCLVLVSAGAAQTVTEGTPRFVSPKQITAMGQAPE